MEEEKTGPASVALNETKIRGAIAHLTKLSVRKLRSERSQQQQQEAPDIAPSNDFTNDSSDDGTDDHAKPPPTTKEEMAGLFGLPLSLVEAIYDPSKPWREISEQLRMLADAEDNSFRAEPTRSSPSGSLIAKDLTEPERRAIFGRWLPEDRYSLDQVPCNLVSGDARTYELKGSECVWVAGAGKSDEGKRICTLQLIVRPVNGPREQLYCGQPWPEICFRGQGKKISQEERASWHPHVWVRFQPKAWYGDATCLEYAVERMPEVTKQARMAQRESVLFADNLHGQTTREFIDACYSRAKAKSHLLPGGVTDLVQLIDRALGALVKHYMGEEHAQWRTEDDNNKKWIDVRHSPTTVPVFITGLLRNPNQRPFCLSHRAWRCGRKECT